MEITASVLLFLGAVVGFMAFTRLSMSMPVPKMTWLAHLILVALGAVALLMYALSTESVEKHYNVLIILGIAFIPGLLLFTQKSPAGRKSMAMLYGLIGMFGLFWLLTYVIPQ